MATNVSAPLPDVTLQPGATVTVSFDDASAKVTKLNVYALNLETGQVEQIDLVPPLLNRLPQGVGA